MAKEHREDLTTALGWCIDSRGGDAVGFVTHTEKDTTQYGRRIGTFWKSPKRFLSVASDGDVCLLHSRYTTSGNKDDPQHAHPFAIKRDGKTVLFGAHNGVLYDALLSAKRHGRNYTVDSKELFELLADGDLDGIQRIHGYGVVTWTKPKEHLIYISSLSTHADIEVCDLKEGGYVYASTQNILKSAIDVAGLHIDGFYRLPDPGHVFTVCPDGISDTNITGVKVGTFQWDNRSYSGYGGYADYSDSRDWNLANERTAADTEYCSMTEALEAEEAKALAAETGVSRATSPSDDWKCKAPGCWEDCYNEGLCFAHDALGYDFVTKEQRKVRVG